MKIDPTATESVLEPPLRQECFPAAEVATGRDAEAEGVRLEVTGVTIDLGLTSLPAILS